MMRDMRRILENRRPRVPATASTLEHTALLFAGEPNILLFPVGNSRLATSAAVEEAVQQPPPSKSSERPVVSEGMFMSMRGPGTLRTVDECRRPSRTEGPLEGGESSNGPCARIAEARAMINGVGGDEILDYCASVVLSSKPPPSQARPDAFTTKREPIRSCPSLRTRYAVSCQSQSSSSIAAAAQGAPMATVRTLNALGKLAESSTPLVSFSSVDSASVSSSFSSTSTNSVPLSSYVQDRSEKKRRHGDNGGDSTTAANTVVADCGGHSSSKKRRRQLSVAAAVARFRPGSGRNSHAIVAAALLSCQKSAERYAIRNNGKSASDQILEYLSSSSSVP